MPRRRSTVYNIRTSVYKLNVPGGEVWRYMRRITAEVMAEAISESPVDRGTIISSHDTVLTPLGNAGVNGFVRNHAEHALWVHEGTGIYGDHGVPIVRPGGGKMVFYWFAAKKNPVATYSVRGQPPNDWLARALRTVEARHPGLR